MDIVCVSHLRWDFVFQRPQQLLTRAARDRRVFYVEEPIFGDGPATVRVRQVDSGIFVIVPVLPSNSSENEQRSMQAELLDEYLTEQIIGAFVLWYYTPMALKFTHRLAPIAVVYDCMDELSAFAGAPPELASLERELFGRADIVFTGGRELFEAKRSAHGNVHLFPSSVDVPHFAQARAVTTDPWDQSIIARPRLGYFGVIDERLDYPLLRAVSLVRPDWQIVLVGPTAKVDVAQLPAAANLHYLGPKAYAELPHYIGGWEVALLPFARNDATRFISPTKTPEYLAAGKPVVSTSIRDVINPYGALGLARIADSAESFMAAIEAILAESTTDAVRRRNRADVFLAELSWERTWSDMRQLVEQVADRRMTRV